MEKATKVRAEIIVSGRVQGVAFRWCAQEEATALRLAGWVRNRSDGTVEAAAEGEPARVDAFIEWCRRGPPAARVDSVEVIWREPAGEIGFRIRR